LEDEQIFAQIFYTCPTIKDLHGTETLKLFKFYVKVVKT